MKCAIRCRYLIFECLKVVHTHLQTSRITHNVTGDSAMDSVTTPAVRLLVGPGEESKASWKPGTEA